MRVGQTWIDIQRALVLHNRGVEVSSFIEKRAVGVEEPRRFRTETNRLFVFSASFFRPAKTFQKISVTGTDLTRAWIQLQRAFVIFFCFIQLRARHEYEREIDVRF